MPAHTTTHLPELDVHAVHGFVAAQPPGSVVLLDVREAWEVQTARLDVPGTRQLHIPMHSLPARASTLRGTPSILVLCHHGARSLQCVAFLQQQGCTGVYNVAGGIDAWSRDIDPAVPRY